MIWTRVLMNNYVSFSIIDEVLLNSFSNEYLVKLVN